MKRKPQTKHRRRRKPHRLIDDLIQSERLDSAWIPLLKEVHLQLSEKWEQPETTFDNAQMRALLSLLGTLFAPARSESATALQRAGNIALDRWYRVEWLGQIEKAVIPDLCHDWNLQATALRKAMHVGREHADRVAPMLVGDRTKGEPLPNLEKFLSSIRRGKLRSR